MLFILNFLKILINNMSKFYAVVKGKVPGVYNSWNECKKHTDGFKAANYKSFKTEKEAYDYIQSINNKNAFADAITLVTVPKAKNDDYTIYDRSILDNNNNDIVLIYVDGSKYILNKDPIKGILYHKGSGAYCRFNKRDYFMSVLFDSLICKKYDITNPKDIESMSSPSFEYLAFVEVLYRFINIKCPTSGNDDRFVIPFKNRINIVFVCDYIGILNFTNGSWKPEEDYIKKFTESSMKIIEFLKNRNVYVHVKHCNGHNGILGNEMSDVAAKSTADRDDFVSLINDITYGKY